MKVSIILTIAVSVLLLTGCSIRQDDSRVVEMLNDSRLATADPEIRSAFELIGRMPGSADGYTRLAVVYIREARTTGDFGLNSKAQSAVDKALEISSDDLTARKLQASLHLTFHRFADALQAGKALQKQYPDDSFVYGVLTDANAELGNYDDAVSAAQRMVDLKPNASSYARVGHLRSLYGDHQGSVEMLTLAAQITDPADQEGKAWCLVQLGDEYWKHGEFERSEKAYDDALATLPEYYFALAGKGRARAAVGDLQTSVQLLTDSQNRAPYVETIIFLGDLYSVEGNVEKAKQQYDLFEVVEQKIGLNNDQKRLALLWADHDTRLDEALTIAEREYAVRKDLLTADTAAWCRYKKGDFVGAKIAIDDAMKLNTYDARTLYHAGMIYKGIGDRKQAGRLLASALKINPSFDLVQSPIARTALAELQ